MRKLKDEYAGSCNNMVGLTYDDIVKNHIICSGNYIEELENKVDKYKELLNESELRRYDLRRCLDRLNRDSIELEQQNNEKDSIIADLHELKSEKFIMKKKLLELEQQKAELIELIKSICTANGIKFDSVMDVVKEINDNELVEWHNR